MLFTRVLYLVEDACDAIWHGPEWLRPAVGGLLLGLVLLVLPQMYGVGYPVLAAGVAGTYTIGFLMVPVLGKMMATSLTIGIGGSGGVFAPSLLIGADHRSDRHVRADREYSIILPLMSAIVLASAISRRISADTIYMLKLRRRGIDLNAPDRPYPGPTRSPCPRSCWPCPKASPSAPSCHRS